MKEVVDYRVLSPGDLANSVMTEGGWSDFLVFPCLLPSSPILIYLMLAKKRLIRLENMRLLLFFDHPLFHINSIKRQIL